MPNWFTRYFEHELRVYAVAATCAVLMIPILGITSALIGDMVWAIAISLVLTLVVFLLGRLWVRRVLARPRSTKPTEKPLSLLSEYELAVEREKAEHNGDQRQLEAIRAFRQSRERSA